MNLLDLFRSAVADSVPDAVPPDIACEDAPKRLATAPETDELRALIAEVLRDDEEAERTEALAVARRDPDAALLSLRALRDERRLNEKWLGRRYTNLRETGRASK
jgi:hypothetical protein